VDGRWPDRFAPALKCLVLTVSERFIAIVQRAEDDLPLDKAALLLAAHAEPDLDIGVQLARLDHLAARVEQPTAAGVTELLFEEVGLRGNHEDYGDPRNSFLDQVLDRGVGIPISLAVLVIEVGRRVGVNFEGIGMPGHFLLRNDGVLRDPFRRGRVLSTDDATELFQALHGPAATLSPALLTPVGPRAILGRMLANLRNSYAARGDAGALAWVARLRASIPGVSRAERAELARLLVNVGQFADAGDVLDKLALSADDNEGHRLQARAALLRARLN
jgi:regulator of sirC expression with transglutaminase-like and TPR domain